MAGESSISLQVGDARPRDSRATTTRLTRRASLNAAALLVDYVAKIGVGLIVTPILLGGLGRGLFGAWEMLNRLVNYLQAGDGRPTEALRLVIAQRQHSEDTGARRRAVGAALIVWLTLVPVVLLVSALFVRFAPALVGAGAGEAEAIRVTCVLLVLSFLLASLASVPESVLRGMNLGYRRMGWQAAISVLGGALAAVAVSRGFGLAGLGVAQLIVAATTGVCFLWLVRGALDWFGADRPSRAEVRSLLGVSAWLSLGELVARITLASDVILIGALIGPEIVTTYVLTGNASRVATGLHQMVASAAIPGFGGMLGGGQFERAARAREALLVLTWLSLTVVGAALLLWNRSFVTLWVGSQHYAGLWPNLFITLAAVQTAFIRVDAYVLDAALRPRQRVLVGALAAVATVGLGTTLTLAFGLNGLCLSVLASRATQSVAYPILARSSLRLARPRRLHTTRAVAVTMLLFAVAAIGGERIVVPGWFTLAAGMLFSLALVAGLALGFGLDRNTRRACVQRVRMILAHEGAR